MDTESKLSRLRPTAETTLVSDLYVDSPAKCESFIVSEGDSKVFRASFGFDKSAIPSNISFEAWLALPDNTEDAPELQSTPRSNVIDVATGTSSLCLWLCAASNEPHDSENYSLIRVTGFIVIEDDAGGERRIWVSIRMGKSFLYCDVPQLAFLNCVPKRKYFQEFTIWNRSEIRLLFQCRSTHSDVISIQVLGDEPDFVVEQNEKGDLNNVSLSAYCSVRIGVFFTPETAGIFNHRILIVNINNSANNKIVPIRTSVNRVIKNSDLNALCPLVIRDADEDNGQILEAIAFDDCLVGQTVSKRIRIQYHGTLDDTPEIALASTSPHIKFVVDKSETIEKRTKNTPVISYSEETSEKSGNVNNSLNEYDEAFKICEKFILRDKPDKFVDHTPKEANSHATLESDSYGSLNGNRALEAPSTEVEKAHNLPSESDFDHKNVDMEFYHSDDDYYTEEDEEEGFYEEMSVASLSLSSLREDCQVSNFHDVELFTGDPRFNKVIYFEPGMERVVTVLYQPRSIDSSGDKEKGFNEEDCQVRTQKFLLYFSSFSIAASCRVCKFGMRLDPVEINFGDSNIGVTKTKELSITSLSDLPGMVKIRLRSKALCIYHPSSQEKQLLGGDVSEAILFLDAHATQILTVCFTPRKVNLNYVKLITFEAEDCEILVPVRASNIDPYHVIYHSLFYRILPKWKPSTGDSLNVQKLSSLERGSLSSIDFGEIVYRSPCLRSFQIQNISEKALKLKFSTSVAELRCYVLSRFWEHRSAHVDEKEISVSGDDQHASSSILLESDSKLPIINAREAMDDSYLQLHEDNLETPIRNHAAGSTSKGCSADSPVPFGTEKNIKEDYDELKEAKNFTDCVQPAILSQAGVGISKLYSDRINTADEPVNRNSVANKSSLTPLKKIRSGSQIIALGQPDGKNSTESERLDLNHANHAIEHRSNGSSTEISDEPSDEQTEPVNRQWDILCNEFEKPRKLVFNTMDSSEETAIVESADHRISALRKALKPFKPLDTLIVPPGEIRRIGAVLYVDGGKDSDDHTVTGKLKALNEKIWIEHIDLDADDMRRIERVHDWVRMGHESAGSKGLIELQKRAIPVSANVARSCMKFAQRHFNFGAVCLPCQRFIRTLYVSNESAVPLSYRIVKSRSFNAEFVKILNNPVGIVRPFGTKEIQFQFFPTLPGNIDEKLTVRNVMDPSRSEVIKVKAFVYRSRFFEVDADTLHFSCREALDGSFSSDVQVLSIRNLYSKEREFAVRLRDSHGLFGLRFWSMASSTPIPKDVGEEIENIQQKLKIAQTKGQTKKVSTLEVKLQSLLAQCSNSEVDSTKLIALPSGGAKLLVPAEATTCMKLQAFVRYGSEVKAGQSLSSSLDIFQVKNEDTVVKVSIVVDCALDADISETQSVNNSETITVAEERFQGTESESEESVSTFALMDLEMTNKVSKPPSPVSKSPHLRSSEPISTVDTTLGVVRSVSNFSSSATASPLMRSRKRHASKSGTNLSSRFRSTSPVPSLHSQFLVASETALKSYGIYGPRSTSSSALSLSTCCKCFSLSESTLAKRSARFRNFPATSFSASPKAIDFGVIEWGKNKLTAEFTIINNMDCSQEIFVGLVGSREPALVYSGGKVVSGNLNLQSYGAKISVVIPIPITAVGRCTELIWLKKKSLVEETCGSLHSASFGCGHVYAHDDVVIRYTVIPLVFVDDAGLALPFPKVLSFGHCFINKAKSSEFGIDRLFSNSDSLDSEQISRLQAVCGIEFRKLLVKNESATEVSITVQSNLKRQVAVFANENMSQRFTDVVIGPKKCIPCYVVLFPSLVDENSRVLSGGIQFYINGAFAFTVKLEATVGYSEWKVDRTECLAGVMERNTDMMVSFVVSNTTSKLPLRFLVDLPRSSISDGLQVKLENGNLSAEYEIGPLHEEIVPLIVKAQPWSNEGLCSYQLKCRNLTPNAAVKEITVRLYVLLLPLRISTNFFLTPLIGCEHLMLSTTFIDNFMEVKKSGTADFEIRNPLQEDIFCELSMFQRDDCVVFQSIFTNGKTSCVLHSGETIRASVSIYGKLTQRGKQIDGIIGLKMNGSVFKLFQLSSLVKTYVLDINLSEISLGRILRGSSIKRSIAIYNSIPELSLSFRFKGLYDSLGLDCAANHDIEAKCVVVKFDFACIDSNNNGAENDNSINTIDAVLEIVNDLNPHNFQTVAISGTLLPSAVKVDVESLRLPVLCVPAAPSTDDSVGCSAWFTIGNVFGETIECEFKLWLDEEIAKYVSLSLLFRMSNIEIEKLFLEDGESRDLRIVLNNIRGARLPGTSFNNTKIGALSIVAEGQYTKIDLFGSILPGRTFSLSTNQIFIPMHIVDINEDNENTFYEKPLNASSKSNEEGFWVHCLSQTTKLNFRVSSEPIYLSDVSTIAPNGLVTDLDVILVEPEQEEWELLPNSKVFVRVHWRKYQPRQICDPDRSDTFEGANMARQLNRTCILRIVDLDSPQIMDRVSVTIYSEALNGKVYSSLPLELEAASQPSNGDSSRSCGELAIHSKSYSIGASDSDAVEPGLKKANSSCDLSISASFDVSWFKSLEGSESKNQSKTIVSDIDSVQLISFHNGCEKVTENISQPKIDNGFKLGGCSPTSENSHSASRLEMDVGCKTYGSGPIERVVTLENTTQNQALNFEIVPVERSHIGDWLTISSMTGVVYKEQNPQRICFRFSTNRVGSFSTYLLFLAKHDTSFYDLKVVRVSLTVASMSQRSLSTSELSLLLPENESNVSAVTSTDKGHPFFSVLVCGKEYFEWSETARIWVGHTVRGDVLHNHSFFIKNNCRTSLTFELEGELEDNSAQDPLIHFAVPGDSDAMRKVKRLTVASGSQQQVCVGLSPVEGLAKNQGMLIGVHCVTLKDRSVFLRLRGLFSEPRLSFRLCTNPNDQEKSTVTSCKNQTEIVKFSSSRREYALQITNDSESEAILYVFCLSDCFSTKILRDEELYGRLGDKGQNALQSKKVKLRPHDKTVLMVSCKADSILELEGQGLSISGHLCVVVLRSGHENTGRFPQMEQIKHFVLQIAKENVSIQCGLCLTTRGIVEESIVEFLSGLWTSNSDMLSQDNIVFFVAKYAMHTDILVYLSRNALWSPAVLSLVTLLYAPTMEHAERLGLRSFFVEQLYKFLYSVPHDEPQLVSLWKMANERIGDLPMSSADTE